MSNGLKLNHPQIMSRILNRPLLLESGYSRVFVNAVAKSSDVTVNFIDVNAEGGKSAMLPIEDDAQRQQKSYQVVNGVAVLPVSGTLVHKYGHVQPHSGMTGYDGIQARISEANADPAVHTIMLDIDSPGGEVAGCQELAGVIAASKTPVVAYVDEMACSAAYWIASACSLIVAPRSANVGSIGVVWMHADYSGALDDQGIDVTFIHAGAHKVDGNPYEALSEDVRASFQSEIDTLYDMFVAAVDQGRPQMSDASVRNTEARVYLAAEALEIGLIDGVMSKGDFVRFLSPSGGADLSDREASIFTLRKANGNFDETNPDRNIKGSDMTKKAQEDAGFTQADIDAAKAEAADKARADAIAEYKAKAEAAAARSAAIYGHSTASKEMKDALAGEAFASVELSAIVAVMDMQPKSFTQAMDENGGAGLEAAPAGMLNDTEMDAAKRADKAAEDVTKIQTSVI